MNRSFAGLFLAAGILLAAGGADAQVVIQGQAQGSVYGGGSGSVYVQGGAMAQPSPYVAAGPQPAQPVRTIVHTSPTTALLVPGVIALGAGWLLHGIIALSLSQECSSFSGSCPSGDWIGYSWIPIVGPWLAYGVAERTGGESNEIFNILFGVIQDVGLILMILGIAIQQEWEEAVYAGVDLGEGRRLSFGAAPTPGGGQVGASLTF